MLEKEDLDKLKASKNEEEWNAICDEVKKKNNGGYPGDWFAKVIISGVLNSASNKWPK